MPSTATQTKQSFAEPAVPVSRVVVLGAALLWAYWPTLGGLARIWKQDAAYSHGFLVSAVAVVLIWQRRSLAVTSDSSWPRLGLLLIAGSIALRLVGARFYFEWLEWLSLLPCVGGLCLLFGGALAWRRAWPGVAFLVFMLPLPYRLEVALAGPLQSFATSASTYLLQTCGDPAVAEGNVIIVRDVRVGVAEAFSGLRMLVAFFAVTTATACVIRRPVWERGLVVVSAVPIALACNVARVIGTAMVYQSVRSEVAQQVFHDVVGWLMLPLAVAMVLGELWVLSRLLIAPPERDVVPVGSRRAIRTGEPEGISPRTLSMASGG